MDIRVKVRTTCRVCGSADLKPLFSLGEQFVSDFVEKDKVSAGVKCPIELEMCEDCTLVQMRHTAPQELLYSRKYWYRSGVTQTMRDALADVVDAAKRATNLEIGDSVLDIGSNDGTLLRSYNMNVHKVGVEPAHNMVQYGAMDGLETLAQGFWGDAEEPRHIFNSVSKWDLGRGPERKYKIVTACGMFYDLEDPNLFIKDVARVLHKDGVFVAQLMCLKNMLNTNDIGNLCHEHLEYYTLKSLEELMRRNNLKIHDIETVPVNGESYRLYIKHQGCGHTTKYTGAYVAECGIEGDLQQFFAQAEANKRDVVHFVRQEVARGKRIYVYGASTKGNVILQWYGLDSTLIEGAADRSPEKHGLYTVGTGIPIYSEEYARAQNPDYFLVLPYCFLDEFIEREAEWRQRGGRFVVPLPKMRVV